MRRLTYWALLFSIFMPIQTEARISSTSMPDIAPYLLPDAPTFELTITQFRQQFSSLNPSTPLQEYWAISDSPVQKVVTIAATKINETLYSSAVLELGTGKIKSMQITWLPVPGNQAQQSRQQAIHYMVNLVHFFSPQYTMKQSQEHVTNLLRAGKSKAYTVSSEGAVRYILSNKGDGGITFAAEPIKLVLDNQD